MINIVRLMMFAVHVQEHLRPKLPFGHGIVKRLNPQRLNQKEVQTRFRAMLLNPVNEKIIRVQLMRHYHIIRSDHCAQLSFLPAPSVKNRLPVEERRLGALQQSTERAETAPGKQIDAQTSMEKQAVNDR